MRHQRCLVWPVGICINVYVSKYIANNVILPIISITYTVKVNEANVSRVQCSKKDDMLCFARALIGLGHWRFTTFKDHLLAIESHNNLFATCWNQIQSKAWKFLLARRMSVAEGKLGEAPQHRMGKTASWKSNWDLDSPKQSVMSQSREFPLLRLLLFDVQEWKNLRWRKNEAKILPLSHMGVWRLILKAELSRPAPILEIDYRSYHGRRTKDVLGGPKSWGRKKRVTKIEIYVIFGIFAFCGRKTKADFKATLSA